MKIGMRSILAAVSSLVLAAGELRSQQPIPVGSEFQVNTYTTSFQYRAAVSSVGSDGFVVVWQSWGSSGTDESDFSVQGQRYGPDGLPAGGEFQVNSYTTGSQSVPAAGSDGAGGFVVTWVSYISVAAGPTLHSIQGQRYASDGSPVGGEFQVNTNTSGNMRYSAVSPDGGQGFVVTWRSDDMNDIGVQGQRFAAGGAFSGDEFHVNTYTNLSHPYPAVSPDGAGGFVIVWQSWGSSGSDTSDWSVLAQRFKLPEIFADGFESGDTSVWSSTVP